MKKMKVTIEPFKMTVKKTIQTNLSYDEKRIAIAIPQNKEVVDISEIELHHKIICEIEGDFIEELHPIVAAATAGNFHHSQALKASKKELADYENTVNTINLAKSVKGTMVSFSKLMDYTWMRLNNEGYNITKDGEGDEMAYVVSWK